MAEERSLQLRLADALRTVVEQNMVIATNGKVRSYHPTLTGDQVVEFRQLLAEVDAPAPEAKPSDKGGKNAG